MDAGHQVIEDLVRHGLVEMALIAELVDVEFQGFQLNDVLSGTYFT